MFAIASQGYYFSGLANAASGFADPWLFTVTNRDTVALTAVPASNYVFTGWSGDASGKLNPLGLALNTNRLIMANFPSATAPNAAPVFSKWWFQSPT